MQRSFDVLVVELGGPEGRDGRQGVRGLETVREHIDGEEERCGGVASRRKHTGERTRRAGEKEVKEEEKGHLRNAFTACISNGVKTR